MEDQRCQDNFQTTMLEQTNKYRSLYHLKPLKGSKKLKYVALLAAQRCSVLGMKKAVESIGPFNTGSSFGYTYNTSSIGFKQNAVNQVSSWYDWGHWTALIDRKEDYSYMGCAVSIINSTACHICYYQDDKGADKLELDIVPPEVNIDLKSYNDFFWTQFPGKLKFIFTKIFSDPKQIDKKRKKIVF